MAATQLPTDDATLSGLAAVLADVGNPDPTARNAAEARISAALGMGGFGICLLKLVNHAKVDADTHHQASIQFKNLVLQRWTPADEIVPGAVSEADRALIRDHLVDLMLTTAPAVRSQLSEAVALISNLDFPTHWPTLLPALSKHASSADPAVIIGVLETATAVFERFDGAYECDDVVIALKFCLEGFSDTLYGIIRNLAGALPAALAGGAATLGQLQLVLHGLDLCTQSFHHLTYVVVADMVTPHLAEVMPVFIGLLSIQSPALEAKADPNQPSVLEKAQASACRLVALFADRHDEDFSDFFSSAVAGVWQLLTRISKAGMDSVGAPRFGPILAQGIRFLSSGARKSIYRSTFEGEAKLRPVIEHIVLPNTMLSPDDMEVFSDQPEAFISRDVEGSDTESRRHSAQELIKGLSTQFEGQVGAIVLGHVTNMITNYNSDKANNWRQLEAAIVLVSALAVRGQTRAKGVTDLSPVVNPLEFFSSCVLPLLKEGETPATLNAAPMLKAAALNFVTVFRNQFTAPQLSALVTALIPFLGAEEEVVNTYAAIALEAVASVRGDPVTVATAPVREAGAALATPAAAAAAAAAVSLLSRGASGPLRLPREALVPHLATIVPALTMQPTRLMDKAQAGDSSARRDNPYHMRCATRILATMRSHVRAAALPCLGAFSALLGRAIEDPCRPLLHQALFEAICAASRAAVVADGPPVAATLDAGLRPTFQSILSKPVPELLPFVLQTMALITRLGAADGADVAKGAATGASAGKAAAAATGTAASSPLPDGAKALLPTVLTEGAWADVGMVPAIAAFVAACAQRDPAGFVAAGLVNTTCARIVDGIQRRATEEVSYRLFRVLVACMPAATLAPVLAPAISAFAARLAKVAKRGGVRVLRMLLPTLATISGVHGAAALQPALDTAMAADGGAVGFITHVAGPQMNKVLGSKARLTCLFGWSRMLAESPAIRGDMAGLAAIIGGLCALTMAHQDSTIGAAEAEADAEDAAAVHEDTGTSFTRLIQAAPAMNRSDGLPCPDPIGVLVSALASVSKAAPGALPAVLGGFDAAVATQLKAWCDSKGVTIV